MRKCPECGERTMEFDGYFGRFRCFNPKCAWMPPSSVEREIKLLRTHQRLRLLSEHEIADLQIKVRFFYDDENSALICDFDLNEPTHDLPEPDGIMIWRIGSDTGSVAGFIILKPKQFRKVRVNFWARKQEIEQTLQSLPTPFRTGRPSRVLIEKVSVLADREPLSPPKTDPLRDLVEDACSKI